MVKVAGADLRRAMVKAADLALPRAPGMSDSRRQGGANSPTPNLVPRQPAPVPALDRTRPEAVAAQKTLAPPSI